MISMEMFAAQENDIMKKKVSIGGPLALAADEKEISRTPTREHKKKGKKALVVESESKEETSESDDEIKTFAKSLALITKQF